jgi:hypothetical protein
VLTPCIHWYVTPVPVAATVSFVLVLRGMVMLAGCVVMFGPTLYSTAALSAEALPQELVTRTQ